MSLLGSTFGRALGGAGRGASEIANKYIDEAIATRKAEAMASLEVRTRGRIMEAEDAFKNDPTRLARDRETMRQATLAQGDAARESATRDLTDQGYQGARRTVQAADADADTSNRIRGSKRELEELTPAQITARVAEIEGTTGAVVRRAGLIAEGQQRAIDKYREPRGGSGDGFDKLPPAVKLRLQGVQKEADQISKAIVEAQAGGNWDPEANPPQGELLVRQRLLKDAVDDLLDPYMDKPGKRGGGQDDAIRALLMGDGGKPKPGAGEPVPASKTPPAPGRESTGAGGRIRRAWAELTSDGDDAAVTPDASAGAPDGRRPWYVTARDADLRRIAFQSGPRQREAQTELERRQRAKPAER